MAKILTRLNLKVIFRSPIYYIAWFFLTFAFSFFAFVFNLIQDGDFKNYFIAFDSMHECDRIIESSPHDELMEQNGKYAEMFNLQAEKFKKQER